MRLLVIRESNLSSKWHVVDIDVDDIASKWPLKPLFVGVSKNAAVAYASKHKCNVYVTKDATVQYDDPPGSVRADPDGVLYMTLLPIGAKGPRAGTRHTVVSKPPIKLVDWELVEQAEKKATAVLSRNGNKPTWYEIGVLTGSILADLEKSGVSVWR